MGLNASNVKGSQSTFTPMEPGTYPARLCQVIDLGLQAQSYQGEEKPPRQELILVYEFVDEFMTDEKGEVQEDKPRHLSDRFPLHSLSVDKAKSTARYNALDPQHAFGGDFAEMVGTPVSATVIINPGKDGRVYNKVVSIAPMRAKERDNCPELVNPELVFDLDNPDLEVFNAIPEWIRKTIVSNLEFNGSKLAALLADQDQLSVTQPATATPSTADSLAY